MSRLSTNSHPTLKCNIIETLYSKQIFTVTDFIKADSKFIERYTNLTFREILDIRKALLNKFSAIPRNCLEYYKHVLENSAIIPTGIEKIDALLDGGLFTGNIYELSGLPATGKTLFCLTIIKNLTTNLKQNVYFLDTKHNFSGRKLKQMLHGLNPDGLIEAMSKCLIKRINTKHQLVNSLFAIKDDLEKASIKLRLIIIDSLPTLFLQHSVDHTDNNNLLNHMANVMHYIACEYHVAFLVTNLITLWNHGDFDRHDLFRETIACGKYWSGVPNVKLKIEKTGGDTAKVFLLKNTTSPSVRTTADMAFTDDGLQ